MRILFEQYKYPKDSVAGCLWDGISADPDGTVTIDYVGYFYNEKENQCVLILPRVLLEDGKFGDSAFANRVFVERDRKDGDKDGKVIFPGFAPEDIIDPEQKQNGKYVLKAEQRAFIREFAVWIYRAIELYWQGICDEKGAAGDRKRRGILRKLVPVMGRGALRKSHTLLDVILAMREFYRDNQDYFIRVLRERTSGLNKINWTRTITRSPMMMTSGGPVYSRPVNRCREIDFDDELFVIFYTILKHVHEEYGFGEMRNPGFSLLTPVQFKRYLGGFGTIRMKQIRGKYFSDQALRMWDLCYSFFEHQHEIRVHANRQEYLLAHKFEHVFEAMIDTLIGDPRDKIPDGLKDQDDGKRVDHMYRYFGLEDVDADDCEENKIYYIGDSKYYKRREQISKRSESVYKQFTYARNVIQWNLDLFLDGESDGSVTHGAKVHKGVRKLRNDDTEGYAVIPNFFVSARINNDLRYDHKKIESVTDDGKVKCFFSRQFENRLFDRDTFLIAHYDVNFLYVLSLYAKNNAAKRREWRDYVRKEFRQRIRTMLKENFDFCVMTPKSDTVASEFFKEHFRDVVGKVYDPYGTRGGFEYYSLALRKNTAGQDFTEENHRVRELLEKGFKVVDLEDLGQKPEGLVTGEPRNPNIVMSSYNFERAVKELSNGVYEAYFDQVAIKKLKKAMAFPLAAGVTVKEHPEKVHAVFLYNSGNDNKLAAVIQVAYLTEVADHATMVAYEHEGMACSFLDDVQMAAGPNSPVWLWQIVKWVDVG